MPESGIVWQVKPEDAFPALAQAYASALHRGVVAICQKWGPQIENWMRSNHPWVNRTANAEQALHTALNEVVNRMVELTLSHGVYYGWYLEGINPKTMSPMQNAGRWSVIEPALDRFAPLIWADVQRMLR